jgi:hypothetical protein
MIHVAVGRDSVTLGMRRYIRVVIASCRRAAADPLLDETLLREAKRRRDPVALFEAMADAPIRLGSLRDCRVAIAPRNDSGCYRSWQ